MHALVGTSTVSKANQPIAPIARVVIPQHAQRHDHLSCPLCQAGITWAYFRKVDKKKTLVHNMEEELNDA